MNCVFILFACPGNMCWFRVSQPHPSSSMVNFWKKKGHGFIRLEGETQQERTEWHTSKSPTASQPRFICHPVCGCTVESTESSLQGYEPCHACKHEKWVKGMMDKWELKWAYLLQDADLWHNATLRQYVEWPKERDKPVFQATLTLLGDLGGDRERYQITQDCIWHGIGWAENHVFTTKLLAVLPQSLEDSGSSPYYIVLRRGFTVA